MFASLVGELGSRLDFTVTHNENKSYITIGPHPSAVSIILTLGARSKCSLILTGRSMAYTQIAERSRTAHADTRDSYEPLSNSTYCRQFELETANEVECA
jgi:hypothetical protein